MLLIGRVTAPVKLNERNAALTVVAQAKLGHTGMSARLSLWEASAFQKHWTESQLA
jgi:hypothetical protein